MKRLILSIIFTLLLCGNANADSAVTGYPENTTPVSTDIMYLVDDPGGTPASNKITVGNLFGTEDVIFKASFGDQDWGDLSVSSNSITLDADVVGTDEMANEDHGMVSWSGGAATVEDFSLNTDASFGNYDVTLTDKISGASATEYIDMGADVVEVVSDTLVTVTAPNTRIGVDSAAYLNIATADAGATTISATSDGTDRINVGDGADRVDIASDTWDVTNGVMSGVTTIGSGAITSTGAVQGTSITDGTATMSSGSLTAVVGVDASGTISADAFTPDTAGGGTVGTAALEFAGVYLTDSGVIYGQADQSATITSSVDGFTFNKFPITPSAAPDADYEVANKKYIDDAIITAGSGDVTAVGDCADGACLDGTSDGGTAILLYDAQGATTITVGDNAGAVALSLPIVAGTLLTSGEIDTLAELETVSNGGAYMSDMLAATNEANFKSITNLEAGTDFTLLAATHDTAAKLDTLYEAELNNSAGLKLALSDETGTGVAVFGTTPTFTTSIILGTTTIDETEIGILDGLTGVTGSDVSVVTGTAGTSTYHAVWNADGDLVGGVAPLAITHDEASELDALYEAEITNSAGLLAALDDETGTGVAMFNISPTTTGTMIAEGIDASGTISGNLFTPDAADGADIGSAALYFSDVYLADASIIKFGDDQDVTLTHVADTGLLLNLELEVDGTLDADGVVALGDGGDNFSVASDGIDIDTSGNITNAGTIGSGAVTSTGAVQGSSITDGTGTMSSGALSGITTIAASGVITSTNATEASAIGTAAVVTAGGLGVTKDIWVGDDIVLDSDSAVISFGADQDVTLTHTADTGLAVNLNLSAATYGSDGSVSDAELKTIDDGATTEIPVGGGAGSAMVWTTASGSGAPVRAVSPTLTGNPGLSTLLLTPLTAEPTEVVGQIYRADNDTWDPCGIDGTDDYFVICTAEDTYIALWDISGNFYFSTIQAAMKVIPDADGITLTAAQMNAVIVATNASEVQIPADQCDTVTGKWITVKQTGAYAVDIAVLDAADDIYMLDGTKIEGTTHEIQTAGASGNQITLMCIAVNEWWVTGEIGTSTSEAAD